MSDLAKYRPVLQKNQEHAGIELSFSSKPPQEAIDQLKKHGFRWHSQKKLWFAKHTPERYLFAANLIGSDASALESHTPLQDKLSKDPRPIAATKVDTAAPAAKEPNTFAASYDTIGDAKILSKLEGSLFTHMEAFFQDENIYFRRTYGGDSITILELHNAQKIGASCKEWHISADPLAKSSLLTLLNRAGVEDLRQLLSFCHSEKSAEDISIHTREHKGIDVFSPFVEVKPLKQLPDKWTKRNFTQALMSGQFFRAEVKYRYSDDYAYDAAVGFRTGVGLNIPTFAKNEVGSWGICTYCNTDPDKQDELGAYAVTYSEHTNSSKTLWFDVNCDIAEGKRRAEDRAQSIKRYNQMLKGSCIAVKPEQIDPGKCYTLMTLDTNTNSGVHDTKTSMIQGHVLREHLDQEYINPDILSLQELQIEPTRFYTIADFFHRRDYAEDDSRIIGCGNWKQIVSGRALLELTREGVAFPVLLGDDREYGTYTSAYENLKNQADGITRFMFSKAEDFGESLTRLEKEYKRAGQHALGDLIHGAKTRQALTEPETFFPDHQR